MAASERTWAEVKHACCESMEPVPEIAKRSGIAQIVIIARAIREGWQRPDGSGFRRQDQSRQAGRGKDARPVRTGRTRGAPSGTARQSRDQLIRRMYAAIGMKLTHLEERMEQRIADQKPLTQEESERETRELGQMIQGFDKITEVATDVAKSDAARRPATALTSPADIDRVRRELAERLHRAWGHQEG